MLGTPLPTSTLYDDPYQYELLAQMTAPPDLEFYQRTLEDLEEGSKVLELGCGTGRLCRPLALAGFDVTGLDYSEYLLRWTRARADTEKLQHKLTLVLGDMREFQLETKFDAILLPYNTMNHLVRLSDIQSCLSAIARHMDEDAHFIVDTFNPDPAKLSVGKTSAPQKILEYIEPRSKQKTQLYEQVRYEAATQTNHITFRFEVDAPDAAREDRLDMRLFFPQELDALLQLNGFAIEKKLGDYDGSPFISASPHQLVICRLA